MLDLLKEYGYLIIPYLTQIGRVLLIPFATLGVVYIFGRMLEITNSDRSKNALAVIVMFILSLLTGNFNGNFSVILSFEYILNAFFYLVIGTILYVTLCWRLFPRIDALLDKKIAKDDEGMEKSIEEEKKKAEAMLRKAKREEKKVEAEKKIVEKKLKNLTRNK